MTYRDDTESVRAENERLRAEVAALAAPSAVAPPATRKHPLSEVLAGGVTYGDVWAYRAKAWGYPVALATAGAVQFTAPGSFERATSIAAFGLGFLLWVWAMSADGIYTQLLRWRAER